MKFLEKFGLDEKTKFLLGITGHNLINLDDDILEEQFLADQEWQGLDDKLSKVNQKIS